MIFTLELLLEEMNHLDPLCNLKKKKNVDIDALLFFTDNTTNWKKHGVYLCTVEQLENWTNPDDSLTFFLPGANPENIRHVRNQCILFRNAETSIQIANCYLELLGKYSCWDRGIHHSILNNCTLSDMLGYASEIIPYPILVFDASLRLLEVSTHRKTDISGFEKAMELGYTPPEFMQTIHRQNLMPRLQNTTHCICGNAAVHTEDINIFRCHKVNDQIFGYSCVFCGSEKPTQGMIDKVELFFQNLDFYYKENQKQMVLSQHLYENFLISLMSTRQDITSREIVDRASIMHIPLHAEFVLIRLRFTQQDIFMPYLYKLLQKYLPDCSVFLHMETLHILLTLKTSFKTEQKRIETIIKNTRSVLSSYHFFCYVSNTFFELTELYDAGIICSELEQMQKTFSLTENDYYYSDWDQSLAILQLKKSFPLNILCRPELLKMKRYDDQYHTQYIDTLSCYIQHDCDLKQTASAMDMHRNSIAYRLEKIREIFCLSLSDSKTRHSVSWHLELIDYLTK